VIYKVVDTNGDLTNDTQFSTGTAVGETLTGSLTMANIMDGDAGNDSLVGGNLSDQFTPGAGNDTVEGGTNASPDAVDQVFFSGNQASYAVKSVQTTTLTVGTVASGNVFSATLGDQTVSFTATDTSASAVATGLKDAINAKFVFSATATTNNQTAGTTFQVDTASSVTLLKGMTLSTAAATYTITGLTSVTTTSTDANKAVTWTLTLDHAFETAPTSFSILRTGEAFTVSTNGSVVSIRTVGALFAVDSSLSNSKLGLATERTTEVSASVNGSTETDVLKNIEQISFADGGLTLTPTLTAKSGVVNGNLMNFTKVVGTELADLLLSTSGAEVLHGGGGADHFVFGQGNGQDKIDDFQAGAGGDVITLALGAGFDTGVNGNSVNSVPGVLSGMLTAQGTDTLINMGNGNSVLLVGVSQTDLVAGNFEVVHAI
jgi:hypothetical protein